MNASFVRVILGSLDDFCSISKTEISLSKFTIQSLYIQFSTKYAAGGQLGVILNKVANQNLDSTYNMLKEAELDILGSVPNDESAQAGTVDWDSNVVKDAVNQFYFRLNLPQESN